MTAAEKYEPTFVRAIEKVIAYMESIGRDAAEIRLYRDLATQALALAPAITLGAQGASASLKSSVATFGERMQRYLIDQLATQEETRALAPGAAAPAAARLYDALAHLVKTIDDEHDWMRRSSALFTGFFWYERQRHVTPSALGVRLEGLESAVSQVAGAVYEADRALSGANHLYRYFLAKSEVSETPAAITTIGSAYQRQVVAMTQGGRAQQGAALIDELSKQYSHLLGCIRNWATDIQWLLKKQEHPVGGASTYTVRRAVAQAEGMILRAQMEIGALRWVIRASELRAVDDEHNHDERKAR